MPKKALRNKRTGPMTLEEACNKCGEVKVDRDEEGERTKTGLDGESLAMP